MLSVVIPVLNEAESLAAANKRPRATDPDRAAHHSMGVFQAATGSGREARWTDA